jgi:short-subunit dehydrogenase
MELNFFAAAELTREVLPHMRHQGAGHVLNLPAISRDQDTQNVNRDR